MNHAKGRKCREDRLSPIIGTLNFLGMKFEANLSLFFLSKNRFRYCNQPNNAPTMENPIATPAPMTA